MERKLQKMVAILVAMFFLPFVLLAQNGDPEFGVVLEESFENGIPETWVQENINGSINWVVESTNLTYPNGAVAGNARLAFRNETGATTKAVTRLVLPPVDVDALFQPVIIFSYAQEKWSGDFDTLRIYYRRSAEENWVLLDVLDSYKSKWTEYKRQLPNSTYCQVALEATDNMGRGIVIDNLFIRSTPSCFKPSDYWTSNVSNDSIVINWGGSFDAIDFHVKISEEKLTAEQLEAKSTPLVLDSVTDATWMTIKDLLPGKKYYCYIQSNCGEEISEWLDTVFTTSNIVTIPYEEKFNLEYTGSSKVVSYLKGWYYGGTEGYTPFVNTCTQNYLYTLTSDNTYSLVFAKVPSTGYNTNIPAGTRSYTATPELQANVKDLQLSFETMLYYPLGVASERSSIIVGVMVDPEDLSTFTAVDTVDVTVPMLYQDFSVSFENYDGEGKHIAFLSEFNEINRFSIDNLLIENREEVSKINFEVAIPSANSVSLSFVQKYPSYEVIVATKKVNLNVDTLPTTSILVQKTVADLEVINGLNANQTVYIYARGVKGEAKGDWTRARQIRMPKKLEVTDYPHSITFELNSGTFVAPMYNDVDLGNQIPSDILPIFEYAKSSSKTSNFNIAIFSQSDIETVFDEYDLNEYRPLPRSERELGLSADLNDVYGVVAAFPEVDMSKTSVSFYVAKRDHSETKRGEMYVGVIKDARDMNSFIPIDTIVATDDYVFYEYDLSAYANLGAKFFALKVDHLGGKYYNKSYLDGYVYLNRVFVDDVVFKQISSCKSPTDVHAISTGKNPTKATIAWNANGGKKWQVRVATTQYDQTTFGTRDEERYEFIYDQQVATTSVEVQDLQFPNIRYYYWIKPICDDIESNWSESRFFDTYCYDAWPLPYVQNFDAGATGDKLPEFPLPCLYVKPWYISDAGYYPCPPEYMHYYPYLTNLESVSAPNSFCFNKGKQNANPKYRCHVAFPLMEAPADTLQIEFKSKVNANAGYEGGCEVAVGVMTNPTDPNTFIPIKTFPSKSKSKWSENYAKITGIDFDPNETYYIAICGTANFTQDSLYVDDVVIDYAPPCDEPFNVRLIDVTPTTAEIKWNKNADTTVFLLTNKELTSDELKDLNNQKTILERNVIKLDTITSDSVKVEGLGSFGQYYVYMRGYCRGRYTIWTNKFAFRTTCVAQEIDGYKYDFEDDANNACPSCWFVGSTTVGASSTYQGKVSSKRLFLQSSPTYNGAYGITPEFIVDNISEYKVRFKAGVGSYNYSTPHNCGTYSHDRSLLVGIVTDPYDLSTLVILDTLTDLSVDLRTYEVYFDTYKHDLNKQKGKHVIFQSFGAVQNKVYVDDVEMLRIGECPRFLFSVDTATYSSITLNIDSIPAAYEVKYATKALTEDELNSDKYQPIACTTNKVVVGNLEPNTIYYFYARSTADTCNNWTAPFTTMSGERRIVDLPYYDGFEQNKYSYYGLNAKDWYGYYLPTDFSFPCLTLNSGAQYIYKGSRAVQLSTKQGVTTCYLVSPELNVDDISKCQATFYYSNSNGSAERALIVGVVSDVNNIPGTFVPVDTLRVTKADKMRYAEVFFDNYVGTGKHVAFLADLEYNKTLSTSNNSGALLTIDEVNILIAPTCPAVERITLRDISSESLTLNFYHKANSPKFEVKYGPVGFDVETEGTSVIVTKQEATLTGLTASTEYDVYVRALCTDDDKSYWSAVNTYTTLAEAIREFPYNFEFGEDQASEAAKWQFFYGDNRSHWFIGVDTAGLVADQVNKTDGALYISADGGKTPTVAGNATAAWAYRNVYLEEGSYTISFDWTCPGEITVSSSSVTVNDHLRVGLMPATASFAPPALTTIIDGDGTSSSNFQQNFSSQYPTPKNWIELSNTRRIGIYDYFYLAGTDKKLSLADQWQTKAENFVITKETAGYYRLVFFWYNNTGAAKSTRSAAVDNLSIVSHSCDAPYNVKMEDITHNSAEISWSNLGNVVAPTYEVKVLTAEVNPDEATEKQVAFTGKVTTPTSAKVTGLNFFTKYYLYVRALCSATDEGAWSAPVMFTTLPEPFPAGHVFSFEEEDLIYKPPFTDEYKGSTYVNGYNSSKTSYFHEWFTRTLTYQETSVYNFSSSYFSYYASVVKNPTSGTKYKYARTGNNCLFFRDNGTSTNIAPGMTVAMPYAGTFDSTRLVFYMRCFAESSSGTVNVRYAVGSSTSRTLDQISRKITVGTMTDPNDPKTFVAIDTVEYPYVTADYKANQNLKTTDPYHNRGWYQAVVNLEGAKGKYVAFRFEHYGTTNADKYGIVYIDDISLVPVATCEVPRDVKVASMKARSVNLSFEFEGKPELGYYVELATDQNFTNVVVKDTVAGNPAKVEGLEPLTKYYARVKALCNALDASDWSNFIDFSTPGEILFNDPFASSNHAIPNWTFASAPYTPEELFITGTPSGFALNPTNKITENTVNGWLMRSPLFVGDEGMFTTRHMGISPIRDAGYKHFFAFTPVLELKDDAKQHLVFDLAFTEVGTSNPPLPEELTERNASFMVLISADGGRTWDPDKHAVKWQAGAAEDAWGYFDYSLVPNTGRQYSIDLSKYKGCNVQFAFYYYAAMQGTELHLDNVHVNTYETKEYPATVCEFGDYEDENFYITSDRMTVGENKFQRLDVMNVGGGVKDTVTTITINVCDVAETSIADTICEGGVYNGNGFTGLMKAGSYKRKFARTSGCDSIVTLNLSVTPTAYTTIIDTICFGGKYVWNGKEYTETGVYVDTLPSVTGCDSVVTLLLTVSEVIATTQYVNICYGETYPFGSQVISTTGRFEELFKTVDGCDSLVTLFATVLPNYNDTINAVIKEGEEYNSDGFQGMTEEGVYTLKLESVDGCDSIITLNLTVLTDVTSEESITLCFGATYTFGTQEISKEGQYTEVFKAADGGDSTVVLTVTVLPDYRQTIEATICAGEVYNENGFENLRTTGVYKNELKSVEGCDSTITLNLTVLSGDTTRVEFTITTDDLPYEYQGLYFDKTTKPGTYVDTIVIETENCEEVIIHTLIVEQGVAVDNVNSYDLIMVPNPVTVNGTLYINAEFTPEERDGLVVEVFNAIGQRVYVEYPSIYPIEITGLAERGMYVVRIIAGDGKAYTGKIIVE